MYRGLEKGIREERELCCMSAIISSSFFEACVAGGIEG